MAAYIQRSLESVLKKTSRQFPAIVLTGPRQCGKTTLLEHLFSNTHQYVSLEPPDVRAIATHDPRGFLANHPAPVIFDEIQYVPELLPYIKEEIDSKRTLKGQYILTGSQNLLLLQHVTESLAGRAAILKLLPLSQREVNGAPDQALPWELNKASSTKVKSISSKELWKGFLRGFYPELVVEKSLESALWHSSYVQTYLERDIRLLRQIGDLSQFQNFLRLLAIRSGQLLNLSDLARDLGVAVNTLKAWLSVLEATYQVIVLRPYFSNRGKRLVKTAKVYFTDVGILCYLVGLRDPDHAALGPMAGAIFETAVLIEIFKTFLHRGVEPNLYFWRTADGMEVDILVALEDQLIPIEVKLTATPQISMVRSLKKFMELFEDQVKQGYVIYSGNTRIGLEKNIIAVPFKEL